MIVGIDPSLTATGYARIDPSTAELGTHVVLGGTATPRTLAEQYERIHAIAAELSSTISDDTELVVIEAPSYGSRGGAAWERAGLWWRIIGRLHQRDLPVLAVPPTVRAKFATSAGNADKAAVAMAASRMWPTWAPTVPKRTNDEADALVLASIGIALTERPARIPFDMPAYRRAALAKLALPEEYIA